MRTKPLAPLLLAGSLTLALASPAQAAAAPRVPAGTTAAWVVFDRQAGTFVAVRNAPTHNPTAPLTKKEKKKSKHGGALTRA
ncbi:hypothetical protein AB0K18_32755, partial [Nonomuraea sp. NPDC049421]